jgi:hypothetical protein
MSRGDHVSLAELGARGQSGGRVDHRVDQHLRGEPGAALVAGPLGGDGGEVSAGAVAHHRDPPRVAAVLADVVGDPAQRGGGVVGRGRELVLRRSAVGGGDHDGVEVRGQRAGRLVRDREPAGDEPAAVEVHHHRVSASFIRAVDAQLLRPPVPG